METGMEQPALALARFGLVAVVLTAAAIAMLQAVDGVALKWAVDAWVDAPADREGSTFEVRARRHRHRRRAWGSTKNKSRPEA